MGQAKRELERAEDLRSAIEAIAIDAKALDYDSDSDVVSSAADDDANKQAFAKIFQAWADGKIDGSPEEIFETAKEVLEL